MPDYWVGATNRCFSVHEAITIAKTARPAIDPIGDFPKLLRALEISQQAVAAAAAGSGAAAPRGPGKLDVLASAFDRAGLGGDCDR